MPGPWSDSYTQPGDPKSLVVGGFAQAPNTALAELEMKRRMQQEELMKALAARGGPYAGGGGIPTEQLGPRHGGQLGGGGAMGGQPSGFARLTPRLRPGELDPEEDPLLQQQRLAQTQRESALAFRPGPTR